MEENKNKVWAMEYLKDLLVKWGAAEDEAKCIALRAIYGLEIKPEAFCEPQERV